MEGMSDERSNTLIKDWEFLYTLFKVLKIIVLALKRNGCLFGENCWDCCLR